MTMHVKVSGVWKEIIPAYVKVSGVWKEISEGWVKVSGVWKQFYANFQLNLNNHSVTANKIDPQTATCIVRFKTDGVLELIGNSTVQDTDEWINPQAGFSDAGSYEVALTSTTGDAPTSGLAVGVYGALSTQRSWSFTQSGVGSLSGTWSYRVREIADTSNFKDATMTCTATVDP